MKKSSTTTTSSKGSTSPTTIAIISLAVVLGLLQATVGIISLTSQIKFVSDYHREIKNQYQGFSNNLRFAHGYLDRFTLATYLRYAFGALQFFGGLILASSCHFKNLYHHQANYCLAAVNLAILALQLNSGISYESWFGNLIFSILLVTRLILIGQQSTSKRVGGVRTRNEGKPKTSTPKKKQS